MVEEVSGRALREAALSPSATAPVVAALPGNDQPRFTPGPWRAVVRANQTGVRSVAIDMPKGSRSYEKSGAFGRTVYDEQDRANAHLISAVPEMYEADADALDTIEKLIVDLREEDASRHAQRIAILEICADNLRAALAKARGQ